MDSMRGLLSGSHDQDDGAIDAPASVGVDERRMQVRAYNYWASLLSDRAYPSVEDLDLDGADFGSHSVLLDFTAGVENPGIAFLGDRLRAESQIAEDVHYISQIPGRSLLSRLTDHYLQIIANRAPIGFEAEFVNDRGTTIMYRGILLPFSSDDDSIDFIMGVINWKEAVTADQAEELQLSVEQALRSAAPLTAPVPVWADGPDSEHLEDIVEADAAPGFGGFGERADTPPAADPEPEDALPDEPGGDAELADWLALARETADRALAADSRSRGALYQAVAKAWDFALVAEQQPDAFAALLDDAGLTAQDRAPMTPVVKLVFGATYDKTRLAEYACVLGHAKDEGVGRGELAAYLDRYPGGLKGLVKDARARRKPGGEDGAKVDEQLDALRTAHPAIILEHDAGDAEFVVLIARAMPGGHIGIVAKAADDPALIARLAKKAVAITGG